jgi:hypothetical protein
LSVAAIELTCAAPLTGKSVRRRQAPAAPDEMGVEADGFAGSDDDANADEVDVEGDGAPSAGLGAGVPAHAATSVAMPTANVSLNKVRNDTSDAR